MIIQQYSDGEEVVLWMNTVGPYTNRQETYAYFSLPFCKGPKAELEHYHETLGEALLGFELAFSGLDIRFKIDVPKQIYCKKTFDANAIEHLLYAVSNKYWYQMYLDDLPIYGMVGERTGDSSLHIYTHKKLEIEYNKDQIVGVSFIPSIKKEPVKNVQFEFTYEVSWVESKIKFEDRFDSFLDPRFFHHRIHWFSIFNSFMMVIFLVALVFVILVRTLKKDYARYNREGEIEDLSRELGDEYGWKQVHGDVFRPVYRSAMFASFIGTGVQIILVSLFVSVISLFGKLYVERGSILSTTIFIYAITSPVNGYVGGSLYSRMRGTRWIKQFISGALLLPSLLCIIALLVNFVAIYYQASRAIPFLTMLAVFSILAFVVIPLNLIGAVLGKNISGTTNVPCRVNPVPRPIPLKKWFMEPLPIILVGGLLPFGSIFIEMYFIFTSFWGYKTYYVFGFTFLVILIMLIVVSCVSIVCTYFVLNAEDYRWQWISFLSGASVAVYVYLYAIFYFMFKTRMFGFFQTTFYFSYMVMFCVGIGLMCGAVSFLASSCFVRKIYSTVKID
ncbi:Transmembrane 9 superfamily member 3 [Cichlidogyrus casuarinus]|uniref:Transmembrane 9 superfamily member n=1 Tax=Cichlidogyrus casuarinus TaxID=1844966 RepID=A0ABD2Q7K8_9PLAT